MRVVRETDDYIILDEFLEPRDFELMLQYTQLQDYARNPKWMKPWDLADRAPWQSGETVYHPTRRLPPGDPRRQYPTGTALDRLIEDEIPDDLLPEREILEGGEIVRRKSWNVIHKDDLSELLLERTTRTQFVFPVPNRILIMRRGLWHKIGLVKSNAPFARCSVAGFFLPDA